MGYSGTEVVRFLGLTTSAVNRLVSQDAVPEVEGGYFMVVNGNRKLTHLCHKTAIEN